MGRDGRRRSADKHAFVVGRWSAAELYGLIDTLKALRTRLPRALVRATASAGRERTLEFNKRALDLLNVQQLLRLTDDEARRGDLTRVVTRGAMLHADIAIRLNARGAVRGGVLVADGRYQGTQTRNEHWQIGRLLLDLVEPSPSGNDTARLWFRATAAYLLSRLDYAESVPHLKWAGERIPTEAELVYDSGRLQEVFASARTQSAVRSATLLTNVRPDVGPTRTHLKAAEPLFRRAVELRLDFAAARLRLGRVIGLMGRHDDAVQELGRVIHDTNDATTQYLAHMFLGEEQQALGHRDEAASHYSKAASLFLDAQSPHLALAQLARRRGDRVTALRAIGRLLALPADVERQNDPWWTYFELSTYDADALVRELCDHVARLDPGVP